MPTLHRADGSWELERLRKIFQKAESDILKELGRLRAQGLVDYHAVAALDRVQTILKGMQDECFLYVPQMIEREFYVNHPEKRAFLEPIGKHAAGYEHAAALTATQTDVVQRLTMNLLGTINEAAGTVMGTLEQGLIGRTEPDIFRRVGLETVASMQATGRGVSRTIPDFVEQLRREGVTAFVDRAGRKWGMRSYMTMAARTTNTQAKKLAILTADPEHDLYEIGANGTTCRLCACYEGRVYSRSGTDPNFPPLSAAFGKIDPKGPNSLENSYLNIHPNCLHALRRWTPAGRSEQELEEIRKRSSLKENPPNVDPRTEKQREAYHRKELARARWLRDHRQFERYCQSIPEQMPKSFATFQRHKRAKDTQYKRWRNAYRAANQDSDQ